MLVLSPFGGFVIFYIFYFLLKLKNLIKWKKWLLKIKSFNNYYELNDIFKEFDLRLYYKFID